jgi:hypothetical protein
MAHPARTSQLENEVTSATRAAVPIAKTQSAAVMALMFLSVMEELYAVRCDGDVQKCTHQQPCSVHPPLRSSTSMQMTRSSGTGAEEVVGHGRCAARWQVGAAARSVRMGWSLASAPLPDSRQAR